MKVKDCMCEDVIYLMPEATIKDCAKLMENNHIGCVPICDLNKKVLGIVTDRDVILRSIACDKDVRNTPVKDIMTTKVISCKETDEISNVQDTMSNEQIRRIPVVNDENEIVGILTLGNLCTNKNINTDNVSKTLENICNCSRKNAE